jgi:hypothetical protein
MARILQKIDSVKKMTLLRSGRQQSVEGKDV